MTASTDPERAVPPTVYDVRARTLDDGRAEVEAGTETITFDAAWAQPSTGLPGPAELMASSFAACLLKNLARAGALLPFRYEEAQVHVTARRQDAPPRFVEITYELRVVTDEPEQRVELLHTNLRKFGTVYNTLAAVCDVHGQVVAIPPAAGGGS
jgi:uncharacterized OsmC-like protein